jgi:hypothetical protein
MLDEASLGLKTGIPCRANPKTSKRLARLGYCDRSAEPNRLQQRLSQSETSESALPGLCEIDDLPTARAIAHSPRPSVQRKCGRRGRKIGAYSPGGTDTERLPEIGCTGQRQISHHLGSMRGAACASQASFSPVADINAPAPMRLRQGSRAREGIRCRPPISRLHVS